MIYSKASLADTCRGLKLVLENKFLNKREKVRACNYVKSLVGKEKVLAIIDDVRWAEEERNSSALVRESERVVQLRQENNWINDLFQEQANV